MVVFPYVTNLKQQMIQLKNLKGDQLHPQYHCHNVTERMERYLLWVRCSIETINSNSERIIDYVWKLWERKMYFAIFVQNPEICLLIKILPSENPLRLVVFQVSVNCFSSFFLCLPLQSIEKCKLYTLLFQVFRISVY